MHESATRASAAAGGGGSMHEARLCRVYAAQRAMMICQVDESDCGDLDGRY